MHAERLQIRRLGHGARPSGRLVASCWETPAPLPLFFTTSDCRCDPLVAGAAKHHSCCRCHVSTLLYCYRSRAPPPPPDSRSRIRTVSRSSSSSRLALLSVAALHPLPPLHCHTHLPILSPPAACTLPHSATATRARIAQSRITYSCPVSSVQQ